MTTDDTQPGYLTGVKDKDYNLLALTQAYLAKVHRLERYKQDAERDGDIELAGFLGRVQAESRKAAAEGVQLMHSRLVAR